MIPTKSATFRQATDSGASAPLGRRNPRGAKPARRKTYTPRFQAPAKRTRYETTASLRRDIEFARRCLKAARAKHPGSIYQRHAAAAQLKALKQRLAQQEWRDSRERSARITARIKGKKEHWRRPGITGKRGMPSPLGKRVYGHPVGLFSSSGSQKPLKTLKIRFSGSLLKSTPPLPQDAAWRAHVQQMRKQENAAKRDAYANSQAKRAELKARMPRHDSGPLFDGKQIVSKGGRLLGYWRYRGGQFVAEYFP